MAGNSRSVTVRRDRPIAQAQQLADEHYAQFSRVGMMSGKLGTTVWQFDCVNK